MAGLRKWRAYAIAAAMAVPALAGSASASAATQDGVLFGAYVSPRNGETTTQALERLESDLGTKLALVRNFTKLGKTLDTPYHRFILDGGRELLVSFKAERSDGQQVPWRRIASSKRGWRIYEELSMMADSAKALGVPIIMSFHHEPESAANQGFGTSDDFIAAWRKVVSIFRERGATNVKWVWTMTSWSFAVNPTDRRRAEKWYPGDEWVDYLGADPYNWNHCLSTRGPGWEPLSDTIAPFMAFGDRHPGKGLVLPEFGSDEGDPGAKANWLRNAQQMFKSPPYAGRFVAVSYYHNNHEGDAACNWWLDSSKATLDAASAIAKDAFFQGATG